MKISEKTVQLVNEINEREKRKAEYRKRAQKHADLSAKYWQLLNEMGGGGRLYADLIDEVIKTVEKAQ